MGWTGRWMVCLGWANPFCFQVSNKKKLPFSDPLRVSATWAVVRPRPAVWNRAKDRFHRLELRGGTYRHESLPVAMHGQVWLSASSHEGHFVDFCQGPPGVSSPGTIEGPKG